MANNIIIRDMFKLSNGLTVLACDRPQGFHIWRQKTATIQSGRDDIRQKITIYDERKMVGDQVKNELIAIETRDTVELTSEEAQSGRWALSF